MYWVIIISRIPSHYFHRYWTEIAIASHFVFHHGEKFGGKSAIFGNSHQRTRRAVCANSTISPRGTNWSVEMAVTAQLMHMLLFVPFRKNKMAAVTCLKRNLCPESPFYLWLFLIYIINLYSVSPSPGSVLSTQAKLQRTHTLFVFVCARASTAFCK